MALAQGIAIKGSAIRREYLSHTRYTMDYLTDIIMRQRWAVKKKKKNNNNNNRG